MEQTRDAGSRNGAEEQEHDAAENGLVDAAQQGADFAHQREDDAGEGSDAETSGSVMRVSDMAPVTSE